MTINQSIPKTSADSRRLHLSSFTILLLAILTITLTLPVLAVTTRRLATGLSRPLYATSPPHDTERLFIVEQYTGQIKILNLCTGNINPNPFLDIDGLSMNSEQGLLGLAFHPDYDLNGYFYVNYTDSSGTTNIVRYQVSADPDLADDTSPQTILTIAQPQANHNGGWMAFGPADGYLYVSTGDGGGGNDNDPGHTPGLGNGQDITDNLLGKILRLDIDNDDFPGDSNRNYAIPPTNPFVNKTGDNEIWAYGLRNPWRPSFDRQTADFYIADVGQGAWEEVNFQPASSNGGENYGWRVMEASSCNFSMDPIPCDDPCFTDPIHEYPHVFDPTGGYSITGGYVYRGPHPDSQGVYFFADYVTEQIWSFRYDGVNKIEFDNRTTELAPDTGTINSISSFGEDARGNLYIVDLGGEIFQILPEPALPADLNGDGWVNLLDFTCFLRFWQITDCGWCGHADFNDDQTVTQSDLTTFISYWLQGTAP